MREVCKNVTDGEHGTVPCEVGSPYYLLSAKNLLNGKIILTDNERTISKQSFDKIRKRTSLEKYDVLISTVGTIGNLAIADEVSHYEFNRDVGIFKCNKEKLIPEYLYYYLSTDVQQKRMMKIAKGVTQKHLYISDLEEIDIDIPNVQEQSKAIYQLKKIDEKIGLNKKVISILESMAKTLYDYWFVQFDFPDANGHPYKTSGGKMEWNETLSREIPAGWTVEKLSSLCELKNGINYDKNVIGDKLYRIVNVRNITATSLLVNEQELDEIELLSEQAEKYLVKDNAILIARSGNPGAVRILTNNHNVIYCGFIICCQVFSSFFRLYLTFTLKKYEGTNLTKTGGSIMQNVSQETLNAIDVIVPPNDIIEVYNEKVISMIEKIKMLVEENNKLTNLREFLLPMLMNGQVTFRQ